MLVDSFDTLVMLAATYHNAGKTEKISENYM